MKLFYTGFSYVLFFSSLYAQIPNNSFEQWAGGEPLNWYTSNDPLCSPGAMNVFQTSNAYDGNSAVYGKVVTVVDTCFEGGTYDLTPNISSYDIDFGGFPISGRPKQMRGYYIYKPVGEGGALNINVYITRWDLAQGERKVVGTGGLFIFNTFFLDSVYSEFVAPINYLYDEDPDTIIISFGLFANDAESEFYFDNISLSFMQIISPAENEAVIAGEKDTIEWDAGSGNINIMYSLDDGNSYTSIVNNYPADSNKYIWDVPEDLLSAKAKIKIEDSEDNSQYDEKSVYIKPWQLTRLDANDDFELFEPAEDGWSFCNCSNNVWPLTWWEQFIYNGGTDPNTGSVYPLQEPFISAITPDFPDWPAFVDAFGVDKCYTTNPPMANSYKGRATTLWDGLQGTWGGSCYGFAVTSLLYFYYQNVFVLQNPGIGNTQNLFAVQLNDGAIKAINKYFIHQFGEPYKSYENSRWNTVDARQTLEELKEMFSHKERNASSMGFYNNNGSGGHEVTPYKMERVGNSSTFNIRVYDSNNPAATNVGIRIDSAANTWTELTGLGWGSGTTGCTIGPRSAEHLFNISLPKTFINNTPPPKMNKLKESSVVSIYNTSKAEIKISNSQGDIGYSDSIAYSNLFGAVPIIPKTGSNHPPIGYSVPYGNYSIELNEFSDSSSYVFILQDSTIYNYRRYDADTDENDILNFSNGLGIKNSDESSKIINLETIIEEEENEKVFSAENLELSTSDSINIIEKDREELFIKNYGVGKNYDLHLRTVSSTGAKLFNHKGITLPNNSTHQIVPDWENLEASEVKILIDNGNDGTVDDSLFVDNQPTNVKEIYSSNIPNNFELYQNYPNPFNPTTTISFDIPIQSHVTLKIYNILGQEIATLVNEIKQAGSYKQIFDASSLPSGVYLYKLKAGEFISSRKMIVVK